jgi:hypothetical protein
VRGCEYVDGHIYFTDMKKEAYYFSHDANAQDDPKCMLLIDQLGMEGYGIFWGLIEKLRNEPDYKLPIYVLPSLAKRWGTSKEKVQTVVSEFGLFVMDENMFFSERLQRSMLLKSEKARANALNRWKLSDGNATAMQPHSDRNATAMQKDAIKVKKSKEKESKVNDSNISYDVIEIHEPQTEMPRPNYTPSLDNQHVEVDQLKPILMQRTSWRDIQQRNGKYTDEQFEITVNAFILHLKEKGELTKTPKDARFHYNNFAKLKRSEKTVVKAPAYRKLD